MQWTIAVDSSCDDIPNAVFAPNINYCRMPISVVLGNDEWAEGNGRTQAEFLEAMKAHKGKSSSACPSMDQWAQAFSAGDNVIAFTVTGTLSGSYSSAICARDLVWETQPAKRIFVLDSLSTGPEVTLLVEKTCELIAAGLDFDAVTQQLTAYHKRTHLLFMLQHVDNLVKNGRLSKLLGATIGVLGIRLLGCASQQGTLEILEKLRSPQKCLQFLLDEMERRGYDGGKVVVSHAGNERAALRLAVAIRERWRQADCRVVHTAMLCCYYAEDQGILIGFESKA